MPGNLIEFSASADQYPLLVKHLLHYPRPMLRIKSQSAWKPDGAGFARVSVIDGKGASDAVMVRLE